MINNKLMNEAFKILDDEWFRGQDFETKKDLLALEYLFIQPITDKCDSLANIWIHHLGKKEEWEAYLETCKTTDKSLNNVQKMRLLKQDYLGDNIPQEMRDAATLAVPDDEVFEAAGKFLNNRGIK